MIRLAGRKALRSWVQSSRWTSALARRFVADDDRAVAWNTIGVLRAQGTLASIYYLGEYVTSPELVACNVQEILTLIEEGDPSGDTSSFVSVDPTQIGYSISEDLGWRNALRLGRALRDRRSLRFMMIDMEDASLAEQSINLHQRLRGEGIPVAITLQAYLRRTEDDAPRLASEGATIRLCKGAFVGGRDIAWTSRRAIDDAYLRLARTLLASPMRDLGSRLILATHDRRMIEALQPEIERRGWGPQQLEIEMLLGVREPLRRALVQAGHTVRVYVPFGSEWWPYTVRRIGERPANARLVVSALLGR